MYHPCTSLHAQFSMQTLHVQIMADGSMTWRDQADRLGQGFCRPAPWPVPAKENLRETGLRLWDTVCRLEVSLTSANKTGFFEEDCLAPQKSCLQYNICRVIQSNEGINLGCSAIVASYAAQSLAMRCEDGTPRRLTRGQRRICIYHTLDAAQIRVSIINRRGHS